MVGHLVLTESKVSLGHPAGVEIAFGFRCSRQCLLAHRQKLLSTGSALCQLWHVPLWENHRRCGFCQRAISIAKVLVVVSKAPVWLLLQCMNPAPVRHVQGFEVRKFPQNFFFSVVLTTQNLQHHVLEAVCFCNLEIVEICVTRNFFQTEGGFFPSISGP